MKTHQKGGWGVGGVHRHSKVLFYSTFIIHPYCVGIHEKKDTSLAFNARYFI